jgi:hypothetical protein
MSTDVRLSARLYPSPLSKSTDVLVEKWRLVTVKLQKELLGLARGTAHKNSCSLRRQESSFLIYFIFVIMWIDISIHFLSFKVLKKQNRSVLSAS